MQASDGLMLGTSGAFVPTKIFINWISYISYRGFRGFESS